jgi:hypothetical protein
MNLLVSALNVFTPELVRKMALNKLFYATAVPFGLEPPPLARLTSDECLARYARFVQAHAGQRLHDENDPQELEQRLYQSAVEMGGMLNKWLRLHTMQEVMAAARVLYQILTIDLQGDARGEVVIPRCYFSDFYSVEVCRLMSAMDRGLFAGLSNGGELTFTSRITEGQPCCRAHFRLTNQQAGDRAGSNSA